VRPLILTLCLVAASAATAKPKSVTLDVKDADIRPILKSMQTQCGIRNLVIDKEVSGKGTFYFRDVPCEQAFRVVLRTMRLSAQFEPNSVLTVGPKSGAKRR
jgi:type II secretory pathway component HofQ